MAELEAIMNAVVFKSDAKRSHLGVLLSDRPCRFLTEIFQDSRAQQEVQIAVIFFLNG